MAESMKSIQGLIDELLAVHAIADNMREGEVRTVKLEQRRYRQSSSLRFCEKSSQIE